MKVNPELIVDALTDMGSFADRFFNPEKQIERVFGRPTYYSSGDYRVYSKMLNRPGGRLTGCHVTVVERTENYRGSIEGPRDYLRLDLYERYNRTRRREVTLSHDMPRVRIYGEVVDFVESLDSKWPANEQEALDRFEELANYVKDKSVS